MLGILMKWIKNRLGIYVGIVPIQFCEKTKDGTLIAQILHTYEVITYRDLQLLEETSDPIIAANNFKHIIGWLTRLDPDFGNIEVEEIVHGDGTTAITLLYQLYGYFESSQGLLYHSKTRTFKTVPVRDKLNEEFVLPNPLCAPLVEQWDVINWRKDHHQALLNKYQKCRDEYEQYLEQKKTKGIIIPSCAGQEVQDLNLQPPKSIDLSYEELLLEQHRAANMTPYMPDYREGKKLLKRLRLKHKQQKQNHMEQVQLQKELLSQVWEELKHEQEEYYKREVSQMLLHQSVFEKRMAKKLFKVQQHKEEIIQNRIKADEEERKRLDAEFIRALFEDNLEARLKFHDERQEQIKLHRKLYEEKMNMKKMKHEKVCEDVVYGLVDVAVKEAQYREFYDMEPCDRVRRRWATLFIKQQPFFDLKISEDQIFKNFEQLPEIIEDIVRRYAEKQEVLDQQDFDSYQNFMDVWQWSIEEDQLRKITLGMNVLGYIVHRVLLKKYPYGIPLKPSLSPDIEIAVCVSNFTNNCKLPYLQHLLNYKQVKLMQIEDAVNYCLEAYTTEVTVEYESKLPADLDEPLKILEPRSKKDAKKNKAKGSKKSKKSGSAKGSKKSRSAKGSKSSISKKGSKKNIVKSEEPPTNEDKVAQTPKLFPCEKIILSNKAELGKIAKEHFEEGTQISDERLMDMFVEYLLSFPNLTGWVLINFPNTFKQAALLEQALTGQKLSDEYNDENMNKESLESVQVETTRTDSTSTKSSEMKEEEPLPSVTYLNQVSVQDLSDKNKESVVSLPNPNHTESKVQFEIGTEREISTETHLQLEANKQQRMSKVLPDFFPSVSSAVDDNYVINFEDRFEENVAYSATVDSLAVKSEIEQDGNKCKCMKKESQQEITFDLEDVITAETEEDEMIDDKCVCDVKPETTEQTTDTISILRPEQTVPENVQYPNSLRLSQIVRNPVPIEEQPYETPLTAYIKIVQRPEPDEYSDEESIPIFKELEKNDGLEKFYCDQGCYYIIECSEIDTETTKCLAKTIIGDYSLPLKSSVELFGARYKEASFEVDDNKIIKKGKQPKTKKGKKAAKPKSDKDQKSKKKPKDKKSAKGKKTKDKGSKKSKKSKDKKKKGKKAKEVEPITYRDEEVQIPTPEEDIIEPEPRAGEPGWEYLNLSLPEDIEIFLATFWENLEHAYITNFKRMFFNKHILLNAVETYTLSVKDTMSPFISRPDQRQNYLHQFQGTLNAIDLDLRKDEDTKTELLCRIEEFKSKLMSICDDKMTKTEDERRKLIQDNWIVRQMLEITNNSSTGFQLEIDRFVDSVQIISNYYTSMVQKVPSNITFQKMQLPTFEYKDDIGQDLNTSFILRNTENNVHDSIFHKYVEQTLKSAQQFVNNIEKVALEVVTQTDKLFEKPVKDKKRKKSNKLDDFVKEKKQELFEEWHCALQGELARVDVRLSLIKHELRARLDDVQRWATNLFYDVYDNICARYENELNSVTKACELLAMAVTKEKLIQPQLILDGDQLASVKLALFPSQSDFSTPDYTDGVFSVEQLNFMVKVLLDLAPDGYIMKNTFLLLLQDMIFQEEVIDVDEAVPKLWRNLSSTALQELFTELFDDNEYIQWKDFIIWNMMIPFPSHDQLLFVRQQFRQSDPYMTELVDRNTFCSIDFWFGQNDEEHVRKLTDLLIDMYAVDYNSINYVAMLIDLCKDQDPVAGLTKALELSLGRLICYEEELGRQFVDHIMNERFEDDEQDRIQEEKHTSLLIDAKEALSQMIDQIMHRCDSLVITEIRSQESTNSSKTIPSATSQLSGDEGSDENLFLTDNKFSNAAIGFNCRENTNFAYFLPLDLLLLVMATTLPWRLKSDYMEEPTFEDQVVEIYEEHHNENFNGAVLAHEFLNDDRIQQLFGTVTKFCASNPVKLVRRIVDMSEVEEEVEVEETPEEDGANDII